MQTDQVSLTVSPDGTLTETTRVTGQPGPCVGRLPPGLCNAPDLDRTIGEWLANAAHMEAASVHAFEILVGELIAHHAPEALIQAARDAASDERRHAQIMGDLAQARGATVLPAKVAPVAIRSLAEIAKDNAAEGLGREAWGALLALWQAHNATDPEIRDAMESIAWDEVRHAEFSRALHAWIAPRLTELERSETDAACEQAWLSLSAEAGRTWSPGVAEALGMPVNPARLVQASRVAGIAA
jgi:rubrerythrin